MSSYRRHFQHDILRINTVLLTSLSLALSTPVPLLNTTPIEGVRERAETPRAGSDLVAVQPAPLGGRPAAPPF